jgi:FtsX-like permease family/MacB-like periplasmic core domain
VNFRDAAAMALHSARRRIGRVVLTVSAIALAAALLTALLIAVGAARNRVLTAVSDGGPLSGVQVFPNAADTGQLDTDSARLGPAREIDAAAIHRIESLAGVKSVIPLVSTPAVVVPPPDAADGRTHPFRDAVTGADVAQAARLPLTLLAGRLPGVASLHEVVVTEAYLRLVHLEDRTAERAIGTEIEIGAPRVSTAPDGSNVDLRWSRAVVVGVVSAQGIDGHVVTSRAAVDALRNWSATSDVPDGNDDLAQFARSLTGASPNSLLFVVADGLGAVGDVRAGVTRIGFSSSAPESLITSVDRYTTVVKIVLTAIGLIALGVAGLGIANAMLAAVRERRTDIGVLKAIGARDRDVRRLFLVEAAVMGAVGGVVGTALGYAIARLVGLAVNDYLTSQRLSGVHVGIPLSVLALGVGGSCLLAILAGTVPAQRAARIPARQAMSS